MRALALLLLVGLAVSSTGCATAEVLDKARTDSPCSHPWTAYESAFLTDDALVLNGRVAYPDYDTRSPISAVYPIDAWTGLPGSVPHDVRLKSRRAPRGSRPVPIVVVYEPRKPWEDRNDPKPYRRVALTNLPPTLLVNAVEPLSELITPAPDVNVEHALFTDGGPPHPRGSVVVQTPQPSRAVTHHSMLLWLPFSVAFDAATLPFQGLLYWALHDVQNLQ